MSGSFPYGVNDYKFQDSVIVSIPNGGAGESMAFHGSVFGEGNSRIFSGGLVGKTIILTDAQATTVSQKELKFTSAHFANVNRPTGAEIVAALNALLAEATPTVASLGAQGNIIITVLRQVQQHH
jgi:hypothetical protein